SSLLETVAGPWDSHTIPGEPAVIQATQRARSVLWAVAAGVAVALSARRLPRIRRVVVEGESMMPTLAPGDRLVVVVPRRPDVRPAAGDLLVTADPRPRSGPLLKRAAAS